MRRAIALSRRGYPAPNPRVGCVILRDGNIVGEGFHHHAGAPHAEIVALEQAGSSAQGSDVFVTLEPCRHQGRTPPCSIALIERQVASVTVACLDPNPKASGGLRDLQAAGVRTEIGLLESQAAAINEKFLGAIRMQRPFIVGKVAMGLDGRVALPSGESKWITGPLARTAGQRLRADCGAVLVGRGTIVKDDPRLTARVPGVMNPPARIVLDPNGGLSGRERVFNADAPTIHVLRHALHENHLKPRMEGDRIDLDDLLSQLWHRGLTSILVEGGPTTLSRFLKAGLVDRLELFIGAMGLGSGPSWLRDEVASLEMARPFKIEGVKRLGNDLQVTVRPKRNE